MFDRELEDIKDKQRVEEYNKWKFKQYIEKKSIQE